MDKQRTIRGNISLEGIGLHTGENTKIEFLPASSNAGIFFVRKDLAIDVVIKVDYYSVLEPSTFPRRTSVGNNKVYVHTIEHLMAAINLSGIDNLQHIHGVFRMNADCHSGRCTTKFRIAPLFRA